MSSGFAHGDHSLENWEMSGILSCQGHAVEKIFSGKSVQKLFTVSCIFASVWVFSSIQLVH